MVTLNSHQHREVIALIPAAGQATRISPLPCSKELYPIGFRSDKNRAIKPKVVCHYLLENMRLAGIKKAYFLLRSGKWDIPAYLGDGEILDMNLGYLVVRWLYGVPYTLDTAYPFVKDAIVALGYPDILFQPEDSYKRILTHLYSSSADIVLGAVNFANPQKGNMIVFDTDGRVLHMVEKPDHSDSHYSWCTAVWTPVFTEFLHEYLKKIESTSDNLAQQREIPFGDIVRAAMEHGLRVEAEVLPEGGYLDIGTPNDLIKAVTHFAVQEV